MPITVLPPKIFPGATVLMILQLAGTTVTVVILPYSLTQLRANVLRKNIRRNWNYDEYITNIIQFRLLHGTLVFSMESPEYCCCL